MPYILITSRSSEGCRIAIVDGQIEYLDTIATMDGLQVLGISTRSGISLAISPSVAVASGSGCFVLDAIVDSQVKDLEAITIINCFSQVLKRTRSSIFLSMPLITITSCFDIFYGVCIVMSGMERNILLLVRLST